jgi:hypothetical protein
MPNKSKEKKLPYSYDIYIYFDSHKQNNDTPFLEESLKSVRSSYRYIFIVIIACISLLITTAPDPTFLKIEKYAEQLKLAQNASSQLETTFKEYDSLAKKEAFKSLKPTFIDLEKKFNRVGYSLIQTDKSDVAYFSPHDFTKNSFVFPSKLIYWIEKFKGGADKNYYYYTSKSYAESAFKPYIEHWTGCQQQIEIIPICDHPNGKIDLNITLKFRLSDQSKCTLEKNIDVTPINKPVINCRKVEIPNTSFRAALQKSDLSSRSILFNPIELSLLDKYVISDGTDEDSPDDTVNNFLKGVKRIRKEKNSAEFYSVQIASSYSTYAVSIVSLVFCLFLVFHITHVIAKFSNGKEISKYPVIPLSRDKLAFCVGWSAVFLLYFAFYLCWKKYSNGNQWFPKDGQSWVFCTLWMSQVVLLVITSCKATKVLSVKAPAFLLRFLSKFSKTL